jgi:hypothetical protein
MIQRVYVDSRPTSHIGKVRIALISLLDQHRQDGALPTSVRFLFYELVMRRIISKEGKRPDQIVSAALTDLRERGRVPWDWIVDETRELSDYTGSDTVVNDLLHYLNSARINPWGDEWDDHAPLILTESRSLAGVLRGLAAEYRARIASTNGQVGGFLHTRIAPILDAHNRVLYLGDHDLAGNDIENNTRAVLEDKVGALRWERLALTPEQVDKYGLPTITKQDKRFKHGGGEHEAVETEALSQSLIVDIVRTRLDELLPEPLDTIHDRESMQRMQIRDILMGTSKNSSRQVATNLTR